MCLKGTVSKKEYIVCGQKFVIPPGSPDQLKVIYNHAKELQRKYVSSGQCGYFALSFPVMADMCAVSYLISQNAVQIGVWSFREEKFMDQTDIIPFTKMGILLENRLVSGKAHGAHAMPPRTLLREWGKEIVHRREKDIMLIPTVEYKEDQKTLKIAQKHFFGLQKNIHYGEIDKELHKMKHYRSRENFNIDEAASGDNSMPHKQQHNNIDDLIKLAQVKSKIKSKRIAAEDKVITIEGKDDERGG